MNRARMVTAAAGAAVVIAVVVSLGTAGSSPRASCAVTARAELTRIVHRIYDQAVHGRNELSAVKRIGRSRVLARAVASGNRAAVRAAVARLIKSQITRITIATPRGTIAKLGSIPSYAPVTGEIKYHRRVVGHYVLSVASDPSFASLIHNLMSGHVRFLRGRARSARSFSARLYPSTSATVAISLPPPPRWVCAATTADTRLNTIGFVARRIMNQERHSREEASTIRYVAANPAFRRAIGAGSPAAVRAAIIGFFHFPKFHIVRVRAWKGNRLINDIGGPYVLSPATGTIRLGNGHVIGRFMLAIQDDTGYIKLVHRFTGVDVVLHTRKGVVPGSNLRPGPPFATGLSTSVYKRRTYRQFGLTGTTFPAGTLRVSLLRARS